MKPFQWTITRPMLQNFLTATFFVPAIIALVFFIPNEFGQNLERFLCFSALVSFRNTNRGLGRDKIRMSEALTKAQGPIFQITWGTCFTID